MTTEHTIKELVTELVQHARQCYPDAVITTELAAVAHPKSLFVRIYHSGISVIIDDVGSADVAVTVMLTETWKTDSGKSDVSPRPLEDVLREYNSTSVGMHELGVFAGEAPAMQKHVRWSRVMEE